MLSAKQRGIKYHFFSLWYDSTRDWTKVSRTIGKHSNHHAIIELYAKNKSKETTLQNMQKYKRTM